MTNTTIQAPNGRGCGTRDAGGVYLSLGISSGGTITVEDLILDPVKIWPAPWQRGFKILPNRRGWNDVAIFVGKEDYPSLWSFVEETRRFGISRKVPPTFPFEQLTPGKSNMVFIHAHGHPRFDYHIDSSADDIQFPLKGCKFFPNEEKLWKLTDNGYHPTQTKCTFAHQHLAGRLHNCSYDEYGKFTVEMPSFTYDGYWPLIKPERGADDMTWDVAAFMVAPLSHIEMPKKVNKGAANRANKAGYEVIVTDF